MEWHVIRDRPHTSYTHSACVMTVASVSITPRPDRRQTGIQRRDACPIIAGGRGLTSDIVEWYDETTARELEKKKCR